MGAGSVLLIRPQRPQPLSRLEIGGIGWQNRRAAARQARSSLPAHASIVEGEEDAPRDWT